MTGDRWLSDLAYRYGRMQMAAGDLTALVTALLDSPELQEHLEPELREVLGRYACTLAGVIREAQAADGTQTDLLDADLARLRLERARVLAHDRRGRETAARLRQHLAERGIPGLEPGVAG